MKPPAQSFPFPRPKIQISARWLVLALLGVVLAVGLFTSYYTVGPESEAVVQRFGKFQQIAPPGLHFKLPYGIDTATV
ncbi:HflK protein, partial [bacterium]|nr:HflK protein [bacterium]